MPASSGPRCAAQLHRRGHDVVVLDSLRPDVHRDPVRTAAAIAGLVVADVRDRDALDDALDGADAVCHLAAKVGLGVDVQDLPDYADSNVLGTAVLLAGDGPRRGRPAVAGQLDGRVRRGPAATAPSTARSRPAPRPRAAAGAPAEFEPPCPRCGRPLAPGAGRARTRRSTRATPTRRRKVAQEHLAAVWARATGGSVAALRYHNVYGPGHAAGHPVRRRRGDLRCPRCAGASRRGCSRTAASGATSSTSPTSPPRPSTPLEQHGRRACAAFNVGSGTPRTVGEMAAALAGALGGPAPVVTGEFRLGDVRHITADSGRLRRELGWAPRVEFDAGMAELAQLLGR